MCEGCDGCGCGNGTLTVGELKKKLAEFPDDMECLIYSELDEGGGPLQYVECPEVGKLPYMQGNSWEDMDVDVTKKNLVLRFQ